MRIINIYETASQLTPFTGRAVVADLAGVKMRIFRLTAGQQHTEYELHPDVDESLIILRGKLIAHTPRGDIELKSGDSIIIERGTHHKLEAIEETLGMVSRYME